MPEEEAIGETPWRIAGEVLKTYIICEDGEQNVWLIDKHAAHERIRFDALKADPVPPMAQQLMTPAAVTLTASSGMDVPKATMVRPTSRGETPILRASALAPSTNLSAPHTRSTKPMTSMTNDSINSSSCC